MKKYNIIEDTVSFSLHLELLNILNEIYPINDNVVILIFQWFIVKCVGIPTSQCSGVARLPFEGNEELSLLMKDVAMFIFQWFIVKCGDIPHSSLIN